MSELEIARQKFIDLLDEIEHIASIPELGPEARMGAVVALVAAKVEKVWGTYLEAVLK